MREKITIGTGSVETRFNKVETILQHFQRKLNRASVLLFPPCLISAFMEKPLEDGTLFKILLPVNGKLIRPSIFVGKMVAEEIIDLEIKVGTEAASITHRASLRKSSMQIEVPLPVLSMSLLTVSVVGEVKSTDFWLSSLYSVDSQFMSTLQLESD